jgi:hypothetical protein
MSLLNRVSHTFIVPSIEPPATHVPSGVNLQVSTEALCSGKFTEIVAF